MSNIANNLKNKIAILGHMPIFIYGADIDTINDECEKIIGEVNVTETMIKDFESVSEIKDFINFISSTPIYAKSKRILLKNAQKWTKNIKSALLKSLEDYPKYNMILITSTSKLDMTIMSRCYQVYIPRNNKNSCDLSTDFRQISDPHSLFIWMKNHLINKINDSQKNTDLLDYVDKLWDKVNDTYSWFRRGEISSQICTQIMSNLILDYLKTNKQFITAPIYYVNGAPHLGHLYTSVATDVLHRFGSLFGESFLSVGTDEHGQKIQKTAEGKSVPVQDYVNEMYKPFYDLMRKADVKYDSFVRTTSEKHKQKVLDFWQKLLKNGDIYESFYKGWYAVRDEQFYVDDEIENGHAKISGSPVEWVEEKCMFFKLSKYRDKLLEHYKQNPNSIGPAVRYNEVIGMLKDVPDLAVTRSRFSWGIKYQDQVIYVWVDALVNYITAMGDDVDFWINDMIHIIGKDILKFHAIYWPAFLMSAGYPLPKKIYAHGWWTVDKEKMSKSLGNVIDPFELIEKYGVDQIRYCILKEMSFGQDGDFDHERMKNRINSELVNAMGNLVQRVLSFSWKEFKQTLEISDISPSDEELLIEWDNALIKSIEAMHEQKIHIYLEELRKVVARTNQYIESEAPWKAELENKKRILSVATECIKRMSIMLMPIMPNTANEIAKLFNIKISSELWFSSISTCELDKPEPLLQRM